MLVVNASGENFEVGMAQGTNGSANDTEKDVSMALRDFVKAVQKSFGKNAQLNVFANGALDHGGGQLNMAINITNYPDAVEKVVDGFSSNAKGETTDGAENLAKRTPQEGELVSQEEQDRLKKEREEAAKGQVTMDEHGNQTVNLKPAKAGSNSTGK